MYNIFPTVAIFLAMSVQVALVAEMTHKNYINKMDYKKEIDLKKKNCSELILCLTVWTEWPTINEINFVKGVYINKKQLFKKTYYFFSFNAIIII